MMMIIIICFYFQICWHNLYVYWMKIGWDIEFCCKCDISRASMYHISFFTHIFASILSSFFSWVLSFVKIRFGGSIGLFEANPLSWIHCAIDFRYLLPPLCTFFSRICLHLFSWICLYLFLDLPIFFFGFVSIFILMFADIFLLDFPLCLSSIFSNSI